MTAQESLYYAGMQSFNFDQDLVSRVVSAPLPMDAMKGLLHPFLKVEENRTWSPLTVLAEQNLVEEREEKVEYHFLDVNDDNTNDPYRLWLTKNTVN